jgi:intracellular sulfur oxidation DsrE/DsrF family protein
MKILMAFMLVAPLIVQADKQAPWGSARVENIDYQPQKVVYDVSLRNAGSLSGILDRISYLNNVYHADPFDASIVVVLHGNEIPLFAISNFAANKDIMERAQSLTVAGPIEFRMCRVAAKGHGFDPKDIHGFVKMVPMADAELIRLQQEEGYVYMR